jgi:dienelactone hydrolase
MSRVHCVALFVVLATALYLPQNQVAGRAGSGISDGTWIGSMALPARTTSVELDVHLRGTSAVVALGPGHAPLQQVVVRRGPLRLSFALPGIPAQLRFTLAPSGSVLAGTVVQGRTRGTVRLTSGMLSIARFLGAYQTQGGEDLIVLDLGRLGLPPQMIDVDTDSIRALYRVSSMKYVLGAGQAIRQPRAGTASFAPGGSSMALSLHGRSIVRAIRLPLRAREVRLQNGPTPLAGTLLLPAGNGPFPAVVMAHGSGPSLRDEGQAFSNYLALHGIASLTMDKRGEGESGGHYLGEFASENAIAGYAADVVAGGRLLATQKEIDPRRIGLFGGSQAGWVIPRAAAGAGSLFSFAVILSGPSVSEGESDYYASLCNGGNRPPDMSPNQIDAAVEAQGPSGVDPRPDLQRLHIPILWVYGALDQNQPTRLDIPALERLKAMNGADFSWVVFPHANHGLVDTQTGLNSEAAASSSFAHGLFATLTGWLHAHSIGE